MAFAGKFNSDDSCKVEYVNANSLREKGLVVLRDQFPCKIMELHKSAPGKHGSAKIRTIGLDIFTNKKYDDIFLSDDMVAVPVLDKEDYQVSYMDEDGYIKILSLHDGKYREDMRIGEDEIGNRVSELYGEAESNDFAQCVIITIIRALGGEKISSAKLDTVKENFAFR